MKMMYIIKSYTKNVVRCTVLKLLLTWCKNVHMNVRFLFEQQKLCEYNIACILQALSETYILSCIIFQPFWNKSCVYGIT